MNQGASLTDYTLDVRVLYLDRPWGVAWMEDPEGAIRYLEVNRDSGILEENQFYRLSNLSNSVYSFKESGFEITTTDGFAFDKTVHLKEFGGEFPSESTRIVVEGVVTQQLEVAPRHLKLKLYTDGRFVWVYLPIPEEEILPTLLNRRVSFPCVYVPGNEYPAFAVVDGECWIQSIKDLIPEDEGGDLFQFVTENQDVDLVESKEIPTLFDEAWANREKLGKLEVIADVAYVDSLWGMAWLVDSSGIANFLSIGNEKSNLKVGQRVKISADLDKGNDLAYDQMEIDVTNENIEPHCIEFDPDIGIERTDAAFLKLRGLVVEESVVNSFHRRLGVAVGNELWRGNVFTEFITDQEKTYLGKEIEFKAVYASGKLYADNARSGEFWIADTNHIEVLGLLVEDPLFELPRTLGADMQDSGDFIRLEGEVVSQEPGKRISVMDASGIFEVLTGQVQLIEKGSRIEVVGIPVVVGASKSLKFGKYRLLKNTPESMSFVGLERIRSVSGIREMARRMNDGEVLSFEVSVQILGSRMNGTRVFVLDSTGGVEMDWDEAFGIPTVGIEKNIVGELLKDGDRLDLRPKIVSGIDVYNLPEPKMVSAAQIQTGTEDSQWIGINGYLSNIEVKDGTTLLSFLSGSGEFLAICPMDLSAEVHQGGIYRVNGVCTSRPEDGSYDGDYHLLVFRGDDVTLIEDVSESPFESASQIESWQDIRQDPIHVFWIYFEGKITHQKENQFLYLENEKNRAQAILDVPDKIAKDGENVNVVGVGEVRDDILFIHGAQIRSTNNRINVDAISLKKRDQVRSLNGGEWVELEGRVLNQSMEPGKRIWSLVFDGGVVDVILDTENWDHAPRTGSIVRLDGVFVPLNDPFDNFDNFLIQTSGVSIIEIIKLAGWWNARRAGILILLLLAVLGLGGVWILTLRQKVREQTNEIRQRLNSEREIWNVNRDIVNHASDIIFTTNSMGRIKTINPFAIELIGRSEEQIVGLKGSSLFFDEEMNPIVFDHSTDEQQSLRCLFETKKRGRIWVDLRLRKFVDNFHKLGWLGIARDVNETKEYEDALREARRAAEENSKAKSSFLANMSHEIRTPMNGVIGMGNLLLETGLNEEQRYFVEIIRTSSEGLLGIINDILDISKIEAGKLTFESIPINLTDIVEETVQVVSSVAHEKELQLLVDLDLDLVPSVMGDPTRIKQVLLNLIGNAVKFTEFGEVIVSAEAEMGENGIKKVRFQVKDTGVGLLKEQIGSLFRPFVQADGSTMRKFGGTGLGLSISKQIVELLGGRIGVESEIGAGSCFWFEIPFEVNSNSTPLKQVDYFENLKNSRILLVDDNVHRAEILLKMVERQGMLGAISSSPQEAFLQLDQNRFDIILLDPDTPGLDPVVFAQQIKELHSSYQIRVVSFLQINERIDYGDKNSENIDAFVHKPVRRNEFFEKLIGLKDTGPISQGLKTKAKQVEPKGESMHGHVLVVEGNIVNQKVAFHQFSRLGFDVTIADSGKKALESLEQCTYDVVIMDCQMPEMDGYECSRRIRLNPKFAKLPIVAMTAHVSDEHRQRCIKSGMNDYLSKPVNTDELKKTLSRLEILNVQ